MKIVKLKLSRRAKADNETFEAYHDRIFSRPIVEKNPIVVYQKNIYRTVLNEKGTNYLNNFIKNKGDKKTIIEFFSVNKNNFLELSDDEQDDNSDENEEQEDNSDENNETDIHSDTGDEYSDIEDPVVESDYESEYDYKDE